MNKKVIICIIFSIILIIICFICFIIRPQNVWENNKDGEVNFELKFYETKNLAKNKIVSKDFLNKNSYNVYTYNGEVKIIIENKEYDLKEALFDRKITTDDILKKAKNDAANGIVESVMFKDGGSLLYEYDEYNLIKYNSANGNNDLYIGSKALNISIGEK